jgi:hypothetical protein
MEQVKKAALDNAPTRLLLKTTGFFDNMCCAASYMKEQVAGEAIELDYEGDDNSIMQPAFMWMDIDETGEEECKSQGDWTDDEDEDWQSDCEVFSRSPARKSKIKIMNAPATPPYYPAKSPSRTPSTATTEFSCNTSDSWETEVTRHSLSSPNPAASCESVFSRSMGEIIYVSMNKSSAPRTISIPTFKLKKRQSSKNFPDLPGRSDFPDLPGSSRSIPEMRSDSSLGRISYIAEAEAFRC